MGWQRVASGDRWEYSVRTCFLYGIRIWFPFHFVKGYDDEQQET